MVTEAFLSGQIVVDPGDPEAVMVIMSNSILVGI